MGFPLKIVKILSLNVAPLAERAGGRIAPPSYKFPHPSWGSGMRGRWMRSHRLIGVVLGAALFVLLPALFIVGAIDCTRAKPGLFCSIVRFAFDDPVKSH